MILERIVIGVGILLAHILNGTNLFDIGTAIKPDFMILFVIFFALRKGGMSGLWIGFIGGLLTDAALGGEEGLGGKVYYKIGIHSLSFSIIGYLLGKFGRISYNENFVSMLPIQVIIISKCIFFCSDRFSSSCKGCGLPFIFWDRVTAFSKVRLYIVKFVNCCFTSSFAIKVLVSPAPIKAIFASLGGVYCSIFWRARLATEILFFDILVR